MPARGGARGPDGRLWLVGEGGRIASGWLETGLEVEVLDEPLVLTDVDVDDEGRVLVYGVRTSSVSSEQLVLLVKEGDEWRRVGEVDVPNAKLFWTRAAWIGDGRALATYNGESLVSFDGAMVREQIVGFANPFFNLGISDVARHPTLGALMVAEDGRLYQGDPPYDSWVAFDGALIPVPAASLVPFGDGVVFGGLDGTVSEHVPGGAPCPASLIAGSNADRMVLVGDRVVISGQPQERGYDNTVTWLVPN